MEKASAKIEPLLRHGRSFLPLLMAVAAGGFLVSLFFLVSGFLGGESRFGALMVQLVAVPFLLSAVMVVICTCKHIGDGTNTRTSIFEWVPVWVKYVVYGSWSVFVISSLLGWAKKDIGGLDIRTLVFCSSAMWIYSVSFLVYWTIYGMRVALQTKCFLGHPNSKGERRCTQCGRPLWRIIRPAEESSFAHLL